MTAHLYSCTLVQLGGSSGLRFNGDVTHWMNHNVHVGSLRPRPLAFLSLLVLLQLNAAAAPLFYEGFDYPEAEELGDTVTTSLRWENDKSQFKIASGSLEYSGLKASTGNRLNVTTTTASLDSVRTTRGTWPEQTSGTLFVSFLLRLESADGIEAAGDGTSVLTLGKTSNGSHLLGVNLLKKDGIKLGVLKYPSNTTRVSSAFFSAGPGASLAANGSATYLVVAKYEWVEGAGNDVVTVWINPANLGGSEDPNNKVSTNAGVDGTQSVGRLTLSRGPHANIDEIRIGQTWADVTPADAKSTTAEADRSEAHPGDNPDLLL